ncbi:MAG: hypothetical protein K2X27_05280, partial [Candidatus Obscuribacterales bacterium]|nr:hypothetical protein [Candidatus Obscuribacterales bacterium]
MDLIQDIYFLSSGLGFLYIVGSACMGTLLSHSGTGHTGGHSHANCTNAHAGSGRCLSGAHGARSYGTGHGTTASHSAGAIHSGGTQHTAHHGDSGEGFQPAISESTNLSR